MLELSLLFYSLEGFARRYLGFSEIIIAVKYFPLLVLVASYALKRLLGLLFVAFYGLLALLVATNLVHDQLKCVACIAADLFNIFIWPILVLYFCILALDANDKFSSQRAEEVQLIMIVLSGLNSVISVAQALAGPHSDIYTHIDNKPVLASFGSAIKPFGIAASSSPYLTIAAIIAIMSLVINRSSRKISQRQAASILIWFCLTTAWLVVSLSSRQTLFGFALFIITGSLAFISSSHSPRSAQLKYTQALMPMLKKCFAPDFFLFLLLALFIIPSNILSLGDLASIIIDGIHRLSDWQSVVGRIPSLIMPAYDGSLPILGGAGIGSTVNSSSSIKLIYERIDLIQCLPVFSEWEFGRYVCSFGYLGYALLFLTRYLPSIVLFYTSIKHINRQPLLSVGFIFVSLSIVLGAQVKTNDYAFGLLCILMASFCSSRLSSSPVVRIQ